MNAYKGSPSEMLRNLYPGHEWLPWKFSATPKNWWKHQTHQKQFMDWLLKEKAISDLEACYSLTTEAINSRGGMTQHPRTSLTS